MLYTFKLDHNPVETTKSICYAKVEGTVICLIVFFGISTLVGYLMPNPVYTYILNL